MTNTLRATVTVFVLLTTASFTLAQSPHDDDDCRGHGNWVGGVFRIGNDVKPPIVIYAPKPAYAPGAPEAWFDGVVSVRVMVDASGCPASVGSPDFPEKAALVEGASKTLKRWRFQPATMDGQPVRVFVYLKVAFRPLGETDYTIINGITLETVR